jgi:hypothetical protein
MATLIQSKQIEGIVTSSVVQGEFLVSGSLIVTGSNSILGSVTASAISSSFIGDGSGITGITYSQIGDTPQFVGGNNITITSSSNVITVHATLDGTGTDSQNLSITGDQLTILGGNTITIPTGSGVSDYTQLTNVPNGIVSSSDQVLGATGILSGSKTDITSLNTFTSSIQTEVDAISSATSSYLTSSGSVDFDDITNKPNLVSSSAQITITESQISDLDKYSNADVQTYIDSIGIVSGSVVSELPDGVVSGSSQVEFTNIGNLPAGLISGSSQILNDSGILSGSKTDISSLNTFTSSIQTEVDGLSATTSSYLTEVPSGTVSGSTQIIDSLPSGTVSGSSQITISSSQISDLTHTEIPSGTISGSEQLPQGLVSGSTQITITESQISDLDKYTDADVKTKLDAEGVITGSAQITISESQISDLDKYTDSDVKTKLDTEGVLSGSLVTQLPSGIVSGSTQIIDSLPSGVISGSEQLPDGLVSGSTQISITESQISDLDKYTDSDVKTKLDIEGVVSGSYVESLPSGVVSGSSQITISESQISDLSHYSDSDVKTKLDTEGVVSGSYVESLPSGTVSGSSQITITESQISDLDKYTDSDVKVKLDTEGVLSGSLIEQLPSGTISGSAQVTISESQISDLTHTDISNLNTFTSSIQTEVDGLSAVTSSYLTSIDSGIVSSSAQVTELLPSGTVSGSDQITDSSGFVSSSQQVIDHLPSGIVSGSFSGSVATAIDLLQEVSGANYIESESVESRLNTIEGSVGMYYDVSNTVWNNKYIRGGGNPYYSDTTLWNTNGNVNLFTFTLNADAKLSYRENDIVYINNFDRDVRLTVTPVTGSDSEFYNSGSREVTFEVLEINGDSSDTIQRINDSYWILSRHTAGFVDSASYIEASSSFDYRIGVIVASGSGADWNVNLTNIPIGIVSGSEQQYTASIENGFALTSSLDNVSSSLATTIENVYLSSSNFDNKSLVSGSSQIDFRNITNYVADEHIDHTTINISAGDGLDGGGDIGTSRELRLNVTSSHFETGVTDILTAEGVVKTSTLNTDLISTDFSQSVDTRINSISAGAVPSGTVSGSQQVDITQTQNYTAFSSSIATSISNVDSDATAISALNTFTSSVQTEIDALSAATSSYLTSETDSQTLTISGDQLTISNGNTVTIPTGSELPSGLVSSSDQIIGGTGIVSGSSQIASDISGSFTSLSESLDTRITTEKDRIDNILSGADADYDQFVEIVNLVNSTDTENDTAFANHYTSSRQRMDSLESFTGSLDATFATDSEVTNLSSSLSQSIYEAAQSGSGVSSWNELSDIPSGVISGSEQLPSGLISGSEQLPSGLISGSEQLPSGLISGSEQLPSGLVSSSFVAGTNVTLNQEGDILYISASGGSSDVTYDGDRTISNDKLGDLFTDSVNPGTSGSIQEFLNAVFYPNTGPSISTGNQTIIEYITSGTTITTLSGTDPEGQAITFGTASVYTDDLVRVASNGVMTINALAESSSFNTDLVGGAYGHKVEVTATDTFGTTTEKDIYVIVTPNSTPVFRETSTSGNVITSVTANLNESSTDDTLVKRVYFTDSNGDNITIYSSSIDNNHFDVTKYSTYVDIRQNTGSLDYEQQTSYTFSISASDEHYEAGQDSDSIVGLPITINVTDNLTPTVNNQTLSSINENSSNGDTVGSISAADNESNTITFVNFELHQLQLDDSVVSSGSYSGTTQLTDPHENPFQMSTSGVVTRKTGVYLNSDLINEYIYRAQVTDPYNGSSDVALITINITDDTPATLTDNWSAGPYIKESELSSTTIKTTDYGSTAADYGSNQSGTWSSSNSAISINSNGTLSLNVNLSGSVTQSGDTIDSTITFTNSFGTTTTDSLTLDVVGNEAPTATFTNQTSVFDSNQSTNGTNLVSVSISDTESDSPYQLSIGGTDAAKLNAVPQNSASSSWELQASEDLVGGTYTYDVTITDSYSETTTYSSRTIAIAQGDTGTLGGDTTSYIIESAESGDVLRDVTGYNQGNASQLSVSYTDYGSPSVQSYTSSNEAFDIDTSGNITLGLDLSGSVTQSGDTINSDITFVDQYGNIGSGSLSVTVFANNPASATFSENSSFFNTNQATGSTSLVDITGISDTESNTPYVVTLSGTEASSFSVVSQNANGTVWELQPSSDLSAGDYDYNVVITDNYSEVTTYSRSLTISQADTGTLGGDTTSYIIESGENGDAFRDASGFGAGNTSQLSVSYSPNYGSSVVQSFTSSNDSVTINGSGYITFNGNLSGTGSGDTITSDITFDDQYGNVGSGSVTVNVFANGAPTADFSNSGLTGNYNENLATSGTALLTSTLTDTETDTPYSMSLSGTSAWAIQAVPQNSDSSSYQIQVTDDTSSLAAGTYTYDVEVTDNFGKSTTYSNRTFTIAAADTGTLVATDVYIIESATSGDYIRRNTDGTSGTQSSVAVSYSPSYGSPVATNFASSNALIDIDSNGRLSVGNDISGSSSTNGSIIATTITWNDQYSNNGSQVISIDVTKNFAPTVLSTQTFNENTNQASGSAEIVRLNLTDTESNSIPNGGLTFSGYNTTYFTPSISTPQMKLLANSTNIPAGTYDYTASIEDVHGFDTTVHSGSVTIVQADNGTLGGDTSIYSIESAESGEAYRDATGYNNGNTAQLSVSYSPSYGSPSVQTFSSSNPAIVVDNSGNLTLGVDISGSVTQSGDTLSSTITFTDEYGNSDNDTITATIFGNQSPAAGFTSSSNYESDNATSGSDAGSLVVTDVESNSPFTISLGGTDGGKFDFIGTSSPFEIQPTGSLVAGTYSIDITVTDTYSETVTLTNETIVVDASEVLTEGYVYYSNYGSEAGFAANYLAVMGASGVDSGTPPKVTGYTSNTASPYYKFKTGDVGSSSITLAGTGKAATLAGTISGSDFNTALRSAGNMSWSSGVQTIILIPSGSTMTSVPTSMIDGVGGSTAGEYVLVEYADGTSAPLGGTNTVMHQLTLDSAVNTYTDWFVIGATFQNNASGMRLQVIPSSGSISDF